MINKLVDEGYVQKIKDINDRRNKTIHLIKTGKKALEKSKSENTILFNHLISDLSKEELTMINASLVMLGTSIDKKIVK